MGVTELAKIKISNRLFSSAKSAFFKWQTQVASWDPQMTSDQKIAKAMTPVKIIFWGGGGSLLYPEFEIGEPYFLFPESSLDFFRAKKS